MLDTWRLTSDESGHSILTDGVVAMAALVVLAGRLPGDPELGSNRWPADTEFDGVVDQRCEFGFCLLLRITYAPDPVQHLRWGHPGDPLRRAWAFG
jgi:hypothetical protein